MHLGSARNLHRVEALLDAKVLGLTSGSFSADDELALVASPFFETAGVKSPFVQFVIHSSQRIGGTVFVVAKPGLSLAPCELAGTEACLASLCAIVRPAVVLYTASVLDLTPYHFCDLDAQRGVKLWAEVTRSCAASGEDFKHNLSAVPHVFMSSTYQLL